MSYPFASVDPTNLPIAVEIPDPPDRLRQDLLDRLHWIVFGPQLDIAVRNDASLNPFVNHAISSESIADPPISRLSVKIKVCEDKASTDLTGEEEYKYHAPEPLVIGKRKGEPILLGEFVEQVHAYLNANKDEIYRCEDENYAQPTELEDGTMFDGVDIAEFDGVDEGEDEDDDQHAEPSFFIRSGNIPAGSRYFFDEAQFNEIDADDLEVYVGLFIEGNAGISYDQFWRYRARA